MNPDENTPEDGARFQPQMNETPEQSASETPSPVLPAPATPAAGDASFTQSAPVASAEETDAETEKAAPVALAPAPVKRGPGWGALFLAMVCSIGMATGGTLVLGQNLRSSVTTPLVSQTSAPAQANSAGTAVDWEAVSATVGTDQSTDLAVIRLVNPPSDLVAAQFGQSSDLKVGQPVMAIGSPLGLSNTVTTGIISALNRPVQVQASESNDQGNSKDPFNQLQQQNNQAVTTNAIQVDASINPGNSGGPLFNEHGQVIGINSSIASLSSSSSSQAGSIGLGFAIPSDLVVSVVNQLIQNGTVDHARLGVSITTGAARVGNETRAGAQISAVTQGSGAEAAGLRAGDVITAVDDNTVSSAQSLVGYVRRYMGGQEVKVTYVRDGVQNTVQVKLQSEN